jgi:Bacterial membrane protein YfhO
MGTQPRGIEWPEVAVQCIVLLMALAIVFPATFFRGEMLVPGDVLHDIAPWREARGKAPEAASQRLMLDAINAMNAFYAVGAEALRNGEWPLWNHREMAGVPLLANAQSAVLYPPRLLHAVFELSTATTLFILLKLMICGMTAYVAARLTGITTAASRFVSVGWMLCGYTLVWCYWPLTDVSGWIPVVFVGLEFLLDGRYRRGFFALSLGGALILLAGHPETAFVAASGAGLYFVLRLIWERRWGARLWVPVALAGGAWSLALAVSAAQLLPLVEYLSRSHNTFGRGGTHFAPGTLAALWVPRFFGTWAGRDFWGEMNSNITGMVYPGVAVWIGTALALARARAESAARGRILCLAISGVVFLLLAFGAPPLRFVHGLPPFNMTRGHYHAAWAAFVLLWLGGLGVDYWLARPRRTREMAWPVGLAVVAGVTVAAVYTIDARYIEGLDALAQNALVTRPAGQEAREGDESVRSGETGNAASAGIGYCGLHRRVVTQILIASGFLAAALLVLLAHRYRPCPRMTGALLTMLLAVDLILAVRGIFGSCPRDELFVDTRVTDFLMAQEEPCRIESATAMIPGGVMPIYGIEEWNGYDGVYPERAIRFRRGLGPDVWSAMEPVCSIRFYLHDVRIPHQFPYQESGCFDLVLAAEGVEVYENTRAFSRAFLVGKGRVTPDWPTMLGVMADATFDPSREVLLEAEPEGGAPNADAGSLGVATVTRRSATRVVVEASASERCILVLSDAYYPGWRATVDGDPVELFPAYCAFRGVVLPAGEHVIEYTYSPWSFRMGLAVSITACLGSLAAAWPLLHRRRTAPA